MKKKKQKQLDKPNGICDDFFVAQKKKNILWMPILFNRVNHFHWYVILLPSIKCV